MPRILVVDDDAVHLDLYKQFLEIAGYQVETAFSAAATVRRLENASADPAVDLLITDLRFPDGSGMSDASQGMALIRRILEIGYAAPVIVLSGWPHDLYGQPEERLVSRILLKPVRPRELVGAVGDLLA
jgi:CheY-like chemotaxis protein